MPPSTQRVRSYPGSKAEKRERQNVREQARQPSRPQPSQRQPGLRETISAKTMAPAFEADRLEKEFKTASDDRKEQIVNELKDTRSELNKLNKEQAILDLRRAAAGAGTPGLVARDSSGNIITDSSGNPIMTTRGKGVFDETRDEFRTGSEALRQASPELYEEMYPMSSFGMTGIPSLLPGVETLTNLLKGAAGTGGDILRGAGRAVAPAFGGIADLFGLNKIPGRDILRGAGRAVAPAFGGILSPDSDRGGGGGAKIPSLVQQPITTQPDLSDVVLGYGPGDQPYTTVIPRSGYQYAYDAAGNRYEIPTGGLESGETYGGRPFTFREGEPWQAPVGDKFTTATPATTTAAATQIPFDYSQWPQYTQQGIANPNLDPWNTALQNYYG